MKKLTAFLCLLLAVSMIFSLASCKQKEDNKPADTAEGTKTPDTQPADTKPTDDAEYEDYEIKSGDDIDPYTTESGTVYKAALNDFYRAYTAAKNEANTSKKWALMAIAEAKLLESAVMFPTQTRGGNYAISRIAPNTIDYALWGNDEENFQTALITTEFIKAADRAEMKAKWADLKGTGTYLAWAKQFLADKGYTLTRSYSTTFTTLPNTWDALATSKQADSQFIVKTYDGLLEYDCEGIQQPALAESYTVSEDGLTYTFKIRETIWVDSQGRKVADVKADDFVAALQHAIDADGGLGYLIDGIIVGAHEYIEGVTTDFSTVGVKATDDRTLVYTLTKPCNYFVTMLGYGIFAPMSRAYYESKGGKFGTEFDKSADSYTYGKTENDIAYCGAYLVTNATDKNSVTFAKNENYWNKAAMNIDEVKYLYNSGDDVLKPYNDAKAGLISGVGLNASALVQCKADGLFDNYGYVSATNATSFMAFFNLNRAALKNSDDSCQSPQSEAEAARTKAAMANLSFRRALAFSVDRAAYNAQSVGEDLKLVSLRNTYTPGNFVYLLEDATVFINGTAKTYKAGTAYGQIMQDQIDADGVKIKAYDPAADDGIGSSDGFDGWYNTTEAKAQLQTAISELASLNISKENPIQIDVPYPSNNDTYTKRAQVIKQSIEASLDGYVKVNLTECKNYDEWYLCGYDCAYGYECNYDIYDLSGWGPDYGDPSTYLDTFLPDFAGYMVKTLGIF